MECQDFLSSARINEGVRQYHQTPGALLVDVRMPPEYREGHIPGSINIPLSSIQDIRFFAEDLDLPIFVYCLSGARSSRAVYALKSMGYTNVTNLGGISAYTGTIET